MLELLTVGEETTRRADAFPLAERSVVRCCAAQSTCDPDGRFLVTPRVEHGDKGITEAGICKLIACLNEELAVFEAGEDARASSFATEDRFPAIEP